MTIIIGKVADTAASPAYGRVEFSQAVRFDDGQYQVTSAPVTAQVIDGELRTLDGDPFSLPANPENTAVEIREMFGGLTFVWWAAVPDTGVVEYRELPLVESADVPQSVWGPPPWLALAEQTRDDVAQSVAEGKAAIDALGGIVGIDYKLDQVESAASSAESAASRAASGANRAEAAAGSIDMSAINGRIDQVNTRVDALPTSQDVADSSAAAITAARRQSNVRATIKHKTHSSGMIYSVIRVHTDGQFIPGLLRKSFANNYEKQGTSGSSFIPSKELPRDAVVRLGASLLINASGWRISGNIGEIRGAQIKDGVIYHDFSAGSNQDDGAIAVRKDGSMKYYSRSLGDSAASMLADGVVNSWCWGPALVKNGIKSNLATDPMWSASNVVSSIQVIGQSNSGDLIFISGQGVSTTSGVDLQTAADIAFDEGCYVAAMMDRGGSAQTEAGAGPIMLSSDAASERAVPDFAFITCDIESEVVSQRILVPLVGVAASSRCVIRARGNLVNIMAAFTGGSFGSGAVTALAPGGVPPRLRPDMNVRGSAAINARAGAVIYTGTSGDIGLINSTGSAGTGGEGLLNYTAGQD